MDTITGTQAWMLRKGNVIVIGDKLRKVTDVRGRRAIIRPLRWYESVWYRVKKVVNKWTKK